MEMLADIMNVRMEEFGQKIGCHKVRMKDVAKKNVAKLVVPTIIAENFWDGCPHTMVLNF